MVARAQLTMQKQIVENKMIKLKHKGYDIIVVENEHYDVGVRGAITRTGYNSYITSDNFTGDLENTHGCTYHEGNTIGFDTNHSYNTGMSEAQLFIDAVKQAIYFIDEWKGYPKWMNSGL